jgi:hypothetical protein
MAGLAIRVIARSVSSEAIQLLPASLPDWIASLRSQ